MTEKGDDQEMVFELLKTAVGDGLAARLGSLVLPGRGTIQTPNFIASSSRGVLPHLTPDNVFKYNLVQGSYIALEDFLEKSQNKPGRTPPIYETPSPPSSRRLHVFTALSPQTMSILGPRRHPTATSRMGNGPDHISIFTSSGFQKLTCQEYSHAISTLQPDIAIPLADLSYDAVAPTSKRAVRMAERTEDWVSQLLTPDTVAELRSSKTSIFAPTLPVPHAIQWQYLNRLSELHPHIAGLAIYDADILPALTDYPSLQPLPRLSLSPAQTPHQILRQVSLGADMLVLPVINTMSETGLAYTFTFPAPSAEAETPLPLTLDLTHPSHAASLLPLADSCACYTCTHHHRAYLHHLLAAREMLAWTLLQAHNYHVMGEFLGSVREVLGREGGGGVFEEERGRFGRVYDGGVPVGRGERPRARGYLAKSGGGDGRLNRPAWGRLEEVLGGGDGESGEVVEGMSTEMRSVLDGDGLEGGQEGR